ncbi:MAG: SurA N-terminal domain-containing protein [Sheuella sp.]|nr:SurA N-terminal domain-containing protein [Sheuella sp.]
MFDFIRHHQRLMQLVLLLLILPSFVFFGVQGYTSLMSSEPELVSVDGQAITLGEFDRARRAQLEQYRNALGAQFDAATFDTPALREQLLNSLIDQRTVAIAATQGRYSVSDEMLRRTIASIPAVQVDGQFSSERYRQVLAAQGMTPTAFENGLRRDLALGQVLQPIGLTARVPSQVAEKILALVTEQRTVSAKSFKASDYARDVKVSDADIKAWYDANQSRLQIPENLDVEYVVLNESAATKDIKVSDADIESFYKQNQARYGQPERRRVSHILLEIPASADEATKAKIRQTVEDLAKRAAADPKQFAALAKEFSQDSGSASQGGDLGWISRNMLVPQVEDALFKLNKGTVSGVVESPFGLHVLYITDVQPASVKPLADVNDDITTEIRKQIAADRFASMASKLTSLIYDQRDSLKPVSDALNIPILRGNGLTRAGLLSAEQRLGAAAPSESEQIILGNPKVIQTAFSNEVLKEKLNSGAIELSPDTIVALRIASVNPAQIPPLEKVSAQIRTIVTDERAMAAAKAAGEKVLEELKKSAKAETKGFEAAVVVTRQDPKSLTGEQLESVMSMPTQSLPVWAGVQGVEGYAILQLTKVEAGPVPDAAQIKQLQGQLSQAWGAAEEQAALKVLRGLYQVKMLPDAAKLIRGDLDAAKL